MKKFYPGILLSLFFAALASFFGGVFPLLGSSIFAILFGILLNQVYKLPASYRWGLGFTGKKGLQYAIILLGFSMPISQVTDLGFSSLKISILTILIAFVAALVIGKRLGLSTKLASLIGFGTAICGGSAIAASAPILEADEEEIALSISTIFFFNILAVFIFPALGHVMQMSDLNFGIWAGTAINDTSSVVAAAYSYSSQAGDIATIVKLARALMIIPSCLIMVAYRLLSSRSKQESIKWRGIFPWFIFYFILASILSSSQVIRPDWLPHLKAISHFIMAMALFAIGTNVSIEQFKKAGLAPILTGAFAWILVALSSLLIQYFL